MSFTKAYSLTLKQTFSAISGVGNAEVTGLQSGGFALAYDNNDLTTWRVFDSSGVQQGSNFVTDGAPASEIVSKPATAQLTNGNIVCAADRESVAVAYTVRGPILESVGIGNSISSGPHVNPDTAGLALGGFINAFERPVAGGRDIVWYRYNDAATFLTSSTHSGGNNFAPSVAGLADGGYAVAWHKSVSGTTEIWYAVYNANGSVRRTAGILDTVGSVNRDVHLAAYGTGFVAVYTDDGWAGGDDTDISFARYDSQGVRAFVKNVSLNDENDSKAQIAVLDDGLVAITYSYDFVGTSDTDTIVKIFDPTSSASAAAALASRTILGGQAATDDKDDPSLAGYGLGQIAVYHTNKTDNALNGEGLQVTVTWTGDAAADSMTGGEAVDIMRAGGGIDYVSGGRNDDQLFGEAGDDSLRGNGGADLIDGGDGSDFASYYHDAGVHASLDGSVAGTGAAAGDTFVSIENLSGSNTGDDELSGDATANKIYGNGGADFLKGQAGADIIRGGAGIDTLSGGADADTFQYNAASEGGDTITFFSSLDFFAFKAPAFGSLAAGALEATRFQSRASDNFAQDSNDRFIFRESDDTLWFDSTGGDGTATGAADAVLIAGIAANATVTAGDILIF